MYISLGKSVTDVLVPLLALSGDKPHPVTTSPPSSEIFGNGGSAAEQVRPQRLQLLAETQDGAERLAVFIQTWVELLDIQQGLLIHKLQELLGLFGYLREQDRWKQQGGERHGD